MPRFRWTTWLLITWNLAFVLLAIAPFFIEWCDLPDPSDQTACAMGGGLYLALLYAVGFVVWAVGNVILALTWTAGRLGRRSRQTPSGSDRTHRS